jgi:hypothetical protein
VLAITDECSDVGKIAVKESFGRWSLYGDVESAQRCVLQFVENAEERKLMGEKGFLFMKAAYDVNLRYQKIIQFV